MNKIILTILLVSSMLLIGCDRSKSVMEYAGVSDVKNVDGGYIMYKLERGTVSCREHKTRSELACWKNGSEPYINREPINY